MLDKPTFVAVIDAKSDALYRIARTILRNDEDCKDALQETVLKAWANRYQVREEAFIGTWITKILINECRTIGRKRKKYVLSAEVAAQAVVTPADPALRHAVESLPEKLRLPLILHYLEGYSYQEIVTILHIPRTTVRSRLSRARLALQTEIIKRNGGTAE